MTEKQERFCEEYMIDLNATQAAIRAGYSSKSANVDGPRLLSNARVRARVDKMRAEQSRRTGINADVVIRELARIARLNPKAVIDLNSATTLPNASDDDLAAISSVRVKTIPGEDHDGVEREVKFHDKVKALELLGRHLGMFTDKVEHSGSIDTGSPELTEILKQLKEHDKEDSPSSDSA